MHEYSCRGEEGDAKLEMAGDPVDLYDGPCLPDELADLYCFQLILCSESDITSDEIPVNPFFPCFFSLFVQDEFKNAHPSGEVGFADIK